MTGTHRTASRTRTFTLGAIALVGALMGGVNWSGATAAECPEFLDQEFRKLHSSDTVNLCEAFSGEPLLIVNTASHCGFTYQFEGLESLHKRFAERGLVVLGFPSDDFRQEADDEKTTAQICYINYGVTFTMMAPIKVTGVEAHPLFQELAAQAAAPNWNFNKYLVDPSGKVVRHFRSNTEPDSDDMLRSVERLL